MCLPPQPVPAEKRNPGVEAENTNRNIINSIKFECPHCLTVNVGDESSYGRRVTCSHCKATILVPPVPVGPEPIAARLIRDPAPGAPPVPPAPAEETEVFSLSPVARAYPGQILLGVMLLGLSLGLALRAEEFSWPQWIAWIPLAAGVLVHLLVWIRVKSCHYRLTTQRLFVRRGWVAQQVNELELYRVKDVVVDQRALQRLLGYGTITVLAEDDSTPEMRLVGISNPVKVKETIRTQYRAARQREGVRPTEFMESS